MSIADQNRITELEKSKAQHEAAIQALIAQVELLTRELKTQPETKPEPKKRGR